MSARGILTVAGMAVGSSFGPFGAAIGGYIGGAIGGAIDGPVHSSQAILEDLGALKLDYGSTWPRIYGRYRFKVSPIWSSEKRPIAHDEEVDAKGGPSAVNTSYTYEQDWLCWAPLNATGWTRIWRNGELIASRLADSDAETVAATVDTAAWASVTFFDGNPDQMPWSVYEAAVGTENACAYRHRPTLAFESLDLGNSGQAPLIEVEFYTDATPGSVDIPGDESYYQSDVTGNTSTDPEAVAVIDLGREALAVHNSATVEQFDTCSYVEASPGVFNVTCRYVPTSIYLSNANSIRLVEPTAEADVYDPLPVDLADIVRSEALLEWTHEEGALTAADIDVSALEGIPVTGVGFTGSPRETISQLADVDYFGAACSDKLYMRLRGGASVATIPFADTGAGVGNSAEPFCGLERGNDIEVALQVAFTCPGLLRDYEPDTQHSDRLVGESFELRRYQSPVVFEPAEAKGRADTMVYDARIAAHTGNLALGDEYLALEPTDVVTATDDEGNTYRVRIERETFADGVRTFDVVLDDPNVLLSSGITAETDQRAISVTPPAATELVLLDTRLLRDADDVPGHYIAAVGTGRWPGAVAYRATAEAGTYERQASITTSAVAGFATSTLPDWTGGNVFDESSVVRVEVSGGTLTSSTRDAVLTDRSVNAFAIGDHGRWEIVQAVNATLVSPGVYDLSSLLRGRLGTEYAMGLHEAADVVVKLQSAGLRSTEQQASEIGATRYWKGVTVGATLDSADAQEFTAESERLKPPAPVDLRVSNDGVRVLTWSRRTRMPTLGAFSEPPLGEASESYDVEVRDGDDIVMSTTVSEPSCDLASFAQTFELEAGAAQRIRQVSTDFIGLSDGYPSASVPQIRRIDASGAYLGALPVGGLQATALTNNGDDLYVAVINGPSPAYVCRVARTDIFIGALFSPAATYYSVLAADPQGLAFDGTSVWVSGSYSGTLKKLNASTLVEEASYSVNAGIGAMAYAAGDLWVCDRGNDEVIQWDIATHTEVQRIACRAFPTDVFVANGLVFVAASGFVQVFDAASGVLISTYGGGVIDTFRQVLAHNGSEVVFADLGASELVFLDDTTGIESRRYPIANVMGVSGYGGGNLFASTRTGLYQSTVSTAAYGAAEIEAGYTATVYQNSETVGRGYPASIVL